MRSPQWDLPASRWSVAGLALKDLAGWSLKDFIIIVTFSKPAKRSQYAPLIVWHAAAITAALLTGLWYGSLVTSFMMFFRLRLWLEHQGTGGTQRVALKPWQAWILAPHNAWYHWEHHKFPAVSYRNLPALRALLPDVPVMALGQLIDHLEASAPPRLDQAA